MTKTPDTATFDHYLKLIHGIAEGLLGKVLPANGFVVDAKYAKELGAVPVYEADAPNSLLALANIRAETVVRAPVTPHLDYLQAYFKRYRGENGRMRNDIVVLANNYCWARFYAAKELLHCFLDDDGYPATNSIELVNDLIESLATGGFARPDCSPQTAVDEVAWFGALLYLVPTSWLPALSKLEQDLSAEFKDGNSFLYIAQLLRVPELVLRHRLKHASS